MQYPWKQVPVVDCSHILLYFLNSSVRQRKFKRSASSPGDQMKGIGGGGGGGESGIYQQQKEQQQQCVFQAKIKLEVNFVGFLWNVPKRLLIFQVMPSIA